MTDALNLPIRIDVVQKQYKNGMQLDELARLYEVDEETLKPLVVDIVPKKRKEADGLRYTTEELRKLCLEAKTVTGIKTQLGLANVRQVRSILDMHGLSDLIQPDDDVRRERYERLIELLDSGLTISQVASRAAVSYSTVRNAIRYAVEHFGRDDLKPKKKEPLTTEQRQELANQIQAMLNERIPIKEIRKKFELDHNQYDVIRKQFGLKAIQGRRNSQTLGVSVAKVDNKTPRKPGRKKGQTNDAIHKAKQASEKPKHPPLIIPEEPKEEPTMPDVTTASLESAVTAFKDEEVSEVIGKLDEHQKREKRIEKRVLNRDKAVWGDYLSARSEEIEDVTHNVEVLVENGKLIERTTIAYTLERELSK